ncbi:MAG: restriction endonuclease subunit S [Candidatus Vecturithrix sp.]|jgi:type I restriction enzyme S subunit|nr:restriction endonuclease subunit S [Candidatus Vecturithrix sp.]
MHAHIQARINAIQRGEVPEGYRKTKVGIIPSDWKVKELGDTTVKVGSGITPNGGAKVYKKTGRPFLRSQNVGWGSLLLNDIVFIDDDTHNSFSSTEIKKNDVFLNITGASIGRSAVADERVENGNVNQHVCIIRTQENELSPYFLNLFLLSGKGQKQIESYQAGGNRQGLNFAQIKSFKIPLPLLPEQRKIAEILSAWDDAIRLHHDLIEQKNTQKRGLMQLLLTGEKRLNGFNDNWIVTTLGNIANITMGQSPDSKDYNDSGEGKYLIQGNADIKNRKSSPRIWTKTITKECEIGDILMTVRAPVGAIAISLHNACIGRGICSIKAKKVDPHFLFQLLLSFEKRWISFEQGSTFTAVNGKDIQNLKVRIPNQKIEQQKIAEILITADKEIELLEAELEHLRAQKTGLMQLLLTGAIRMNETFKQENLR